MLQLDVGTVFGRLTLIREIEPRVVRGTSRVRRRRRFLCRCECGNIRLALMEKLRRGEVRSCGCLQTERTRKMGRSNRTHGDRHSMLYATWAQMKNRCYSPTSMGYRNYGGRGISVCPEWHDYVAFKAYVETYLGPRPDGHSIDRINNDGNYEPGNVRWATPRMQAHNRRPSSEWRVRGFA